MVIFGLMTFFSDNLGVGNETDLALLLPTMLFSRQMGQEEGRKESKGKLIWRRGKGDLEHPLPRGGGGYTDDVPPPSLGPYSP